MLQISQHGIVVLTQKMYIKGYPETEPAENSSKLK